jgi:3',5'-cyclic AMP phosphodiesterase CpdA
MRFIHISDPHLIEAGYAEGNIKMLVEQGESPVDNLGKALEYIAQAFGAIDFMLITGDLIHEGRAEDYAALKGIIEANVSCPVFPALGNHDRRGPFRQGYLGEAGGDAAPYYLEQTVGGLRIVTLDTSVPGQEHGSLDKAQLDWLKDVMRQPSENGSILILHHPPAFEIKAGLFLTGLANPADLLDSIRGGDVRAIFSGHTHQSSALTFGGIPHHSVGSTAFGVSFDEGFINITASRGFHYCLMQGDEIYVERRSLSEPDRVVRRIPLTPR